jgi:hypothetical protein
MTNDTSSRPPGVCFLVHGESKVGKTYLAATLRPPPLILDAEGGTRFLRQPKIEWDGTSEPPKPGSWEVCIVPVRSYSTLQSVYAWLNSGKHPFRSVTIDSLSEAQQRCVDAMAGTNAMSQQMWGDLLRQMSALVRAFRDLVTHPTNPLNAVLLITMTREQNGKRVPYVQGQLATTLPYYIDIVGYYTMHTTDDGTPVRRLWVQPHPLFEAGDRTGLLGQAVDNPNITSLLNTIHEGVTA